MRRALAFAALLACAATAPAQQAPDWRLPASAFMSRQTQAMQDDDAGNPAMLWVQEGEALWTRVDGASQTNCADCHGEAGASMRGAAARHPAFDAIEGRTLDLGGRVNQCRTLRQAAEPFAPESRELLAITAYVARFSRGQPIAPVSDPRLAPALEAGKATFFRRQGQLDLSCAQCHDDNWGKKLGGATIPQAHPTGYPIYRLEWQGVGSLQRRLRNCLAGVRAQPYAYGAQELVELELYLKQRAAGMIVDAPGVRP